MASWAGAAQGVAQVARQQQQDEASLEQQLADREYKRQLILMQQAQNERLQQQMGLDRDRFGLEKQRFEGQQQDAALERNQAQDKRGVQRMVGELIRTQGITPQSRQQIVGMLAETGQTPTTAQVLADPDAEQERAIDRARQIEDIQTQGRIREITAQGSESRRTMAARPVAAQAGGGASTGSGLNSRAIPAAQKEDLITMGTLNDMANQAERLGNQIGWNGVGGMFSGSLSQFGARHLGTGTQSEQELRNLIGNITATLARLRGGTSFTANEQALLEQYTPTINDGDKVIQAKLKSMRQFIQTKRDNTLKVIGGDLSLDDGGPVVGEHRTINGQLAEWDGAGWLPAGAQ
jgi:hypothetical protein